MKEHPIGSMTITVSDDEFINGFQAGYLYYCTDFKGRSLTEMEVYEVMIQTTLSVYHPCRWNAGYLAGWFAGLLEKNKNSSRHVVIAPCVQADSSEVKA